MKFDYIGHIAPPALPFHSLSTVRMTMKLRIGKRNPDRIVHEAQIRGRAEAQSIGCAPSSSASAGCWYSA